MNEVESIASDMLQSVFNKLDVEAFVQAEKHM